MFKKLLLIIAIAVFMTSCDADDATPTLPSQIQIESITFTALPKFIDIIDYDEMETYDFSIQFDASDFENLVLTSPYNLKNPAIYNSVDGLVTPIVFEIKDDLLPYAASFYPYIDFTRPNVDRTFTDDFIIPKLSYDEIYNNDLAEEFSYEYEITYTPADGFGRLDGTFRYVVKGKFFY
ncbi:hypothetical protein [Kordia jejudonensis]|uniref:hypothetical protein n=1 Tax=Kordia jejudonensis TaxID=1348245 RepID=UPI0006293375|nr:hypothetical protein [Kordia jejudonensis]